MMERTKEQIELEIKEVKRRAVKIAVSAIAIMVIITTATVLTADTSIMGACIAGVGSMWVIALLLAVPNNQRSDKLHEELKSFTTQTEED